MSSALSLKDFQRPILTCQIGAQERVLHSCCAPCSGEVIEAVRASGLGLTVYFYNPNIHPREEYELRKAENIRFAEKHSIPFVDADYDTHDWFARAKGLEWEPERGARCTVCFDMRFERTALYAHENGFPVITSCLGISRWKNMEQINACGERAASRYPGMIYWTLNWRRKAVRSAWWKSPSGSSFTCRSIVAASIPFAIPINGVSPTEGRRSRWARSITKIASKGRARWRDSFLPWGGI